MADGDHCRSIMFYQDPGIDNRRMVPATHFEQRGDAFVPFFQDDNHNEGLEQEERLMEPIDVNEEPFLPVWPVLSVESMEEPPDFLLYDYDDTDDSDDKSSDFEESDLSDDSDLEVNNDEDEEAGDESEIKQNSAEVGDESIPGISQKRDCKKDGQLGERSNGAFGHDDDGNLEDVQSQPRASAHVVEHSFKDGDKWAECREHEVKRNSGAEQDIQKNLLSQALKRRTGGDCEEKEEEDEEEEGGCRYNGNDHDCILENLGETS